MHGEVKAYRDSFAVDQAAVDLGTVASDGSQLNDPLRWHAHPCK